MMSSPYTRGLRSQSPPCWAWYEQIPYEDEYTSSDEDEDDDDECSEDEENYERAREHEAEATGNTQNEEENKVAVNTSADAQAEASMENGHTMDIDLDDVSKDDDKNEEKRIPAEIKGKQRAVEPGEEQHQPPPPPPPKKASRQRRHRRVRPQVLRPIVTIQRSQGFVWNQDLFVPPYIKDRYVASTSPPNAGFTTSSSVSSTHSALTDYEVEVVEIRVNEGDLESIIP